MTASTSELRSAATSTSTTAIGLIRALTDARPIKTTSTRCLSARRPNPGRGSTYRRGNSVQTTAATSVAVDAGAVAVGPKDLAIVVDAICECMAGQGIVDVGEDTAVIEEGVRAADAVDGLPDDLAQIVDAPGNGAAAAQRIVEG